MLIKIGHEFDEIGFLKLDKNNKIVGKGNIVFLEKLIKDLKGKGEDNKTFLENLPNRLKGYLWAKRIDKDNNKEGNKENTSKKLSIGIPFSHSRPLNEGNYIHAISSEAAEHPVPIIERPSNNPGPSMSSVLNFIKRHSKNWPKETFDPSSQYLTIYRPSYIPSFNYNTSHSRTGNNRLYRHSTIPNEYPFIIHRYSNYDDDKETPTDKLGGLSNIFGSMLLDNLRKKGRFPIIEDYHREMTGQDDPYGDQLYVNPHSSVRTLMEKFKSENWKHNLYHNLLTKILLPSYTAYILNSDPNTISFTQYLKNDAQHNKDINKLSYENNYLQGLKEFLLSALDASNWKTKEQIEQEKKEKDDIKQLSLINYHNLLSSSNYQPEQFIFYDNLNGEPLHPPVAIHNNHFYRNDRIHTLELLKKHYNLWPKETFENPNAHITFVNSNLGHYLENTYKNPSSDARGYNKDTKTDERIYKGVNLKSNIENVEYPLIPFSYYYITSMDIARTLGNMLLDNLNKSKQLDPLKDLFQDTEEREYNQPSPDVPHLGETLHNKLLHKIIVPHYINYINNEDLDNPKQNFQKYLQNTLKQKDSTYNTEKFRRENPESYKLHQYARMLIGGLKNI